MLYSWPVYDAALLEENRIGLRDFSIEERPCE